MRVLIFAEHDNIKLADSAARLAGAALKLADAGYDVVIAAEKNGEEIALQAAQMNGVNKVMFAQSDNFKGQIAENIAALLSPLCQHYDAIMAVSSMNGKNFMPRLAAELDVMQISDITAVIDQHTFERPIYAGNAIQTLCSEENKKIITVRETSFDAVEQDGQGKVEKLAVAPAFDGSRYQGEQLSQSDRPELTSAKIVISGGRGMQAGENFGLLEKVAKKLNAAIGASRAAVDAGFVSNDYQVGQTGKIVAPQLYIAVGISGAIQHLAGMKDSKFIVAINKDEEAPIFQVADYGLVADLFQALPELEKALD